jgi:hypothetical protein
LLSWKLRAPPETEAKIQPLFTVLGYRNCSSQTWLIRPISKRPNIKDQGNPGATREQTGQSQSALLLLFSAVIPQDMKISP